MARTTRELRQRRHKRIRRRLSGTAERPRVAVSRTNRHISAQIIDDVAGRTLAAASSVEASMKATSGGNVEGAKAANITTVVFDRGGFDYHGRVAAFADTLRSAGLEF